MRERMTSDRVPEGISAVARDSFGFYRSEDGIRLPEPGTERQQGTLSVSDKHKHAADFDRITRGASIKHSPKYRVRLRDEYIRKNGQMDLRSILDDHRDLHGQLRDSQGRRVGNDRKETNRTKAQQERIARGRKDMTKADRKAQAEAMERWRYSQNEYDPFADEYLHGLGE